VREPVLVARARRRYNSLTTEERTEFDRIIQYICEDPSIDPPLQIEFDVPPVVILRYHDGERWVVYDLPDDAIVRVWMIGRVPAEPRPY
jgi:hypothetical protein